MKKKKSSWVVATDDTGRSVLQWQLGGDDVDAEVTGPLARTYDLLKRLDVADLDLEEGLAAGEEFDPYNTGTYPAHRLRRLSDD